MISIPSAVSFSGSDSWTEKPAFGTALDDHLKRSGREIAVPMEACVMMLLETGMKEEVSHSAGGQASIPLLTSLR